MITCIVCGGRGFADEEVVRRKLDGCWSVDGFDQIATGACSGADALAAIWAHDHRVPVVGYPAYWARHGRIAGPLRNSRMLDDPALGTRLVLAFPGGRGTHDMMRQARERGIEVVEVTE